MNEIKAQEIIKKEMSRIGTLGGKKTWTNLSEEERAAKIKKMVDVREANRLARLAKQE